MSLLMINKKGNSMFIEQVMKKVWEPQSMQYQEVWDKAEKMTSSELYEDILKGFEHVNLDALPNQYMNITNIVTSGCAHCIKDKCFNGCTFCDFYSSYAVDVAKMSVLRQKDRALYAKVVKYGVEIQRKNSTPALVEYFSAHDTLDEKAITDEVIQELSKVQDEAKRQTFNCFFETRASSVTEEKLIRWKSQVADKISNRAELVFGTETSDEWLRNHWLNKNIRDEEIDRAISIGKKQKCFVGTTVLMGIPGLPDVYGMKMFVETFLSISRKDVNHIICSPMLPKKSSLQGYIAKEMKENKALQEAGIINGFFTGMPNIVMVFEALCTVIREGIEVSKKLVLCPSFFPPYLEKVREGFRDSVNKKEVNFLCDAIQAFTMNADVKMMLKAREQAAEWKFFTDYLEILNKQKEQGDIEHVMQITATELAKHFWPDRWEEYLNMLTGELEERRKQNENMSNKSTF